MNMKGSLPMLVLRVLNTGDHHGYRIAKQIKEQSDGVLDFKEGTLYPTLHGLENQGLIESYEQDKNGRTRRYYRITDTGRGELVNQQAEWEQFSRAVNQILNQEA